jgi:hypothetical protein
MKERTGVRMDGVLAGRAGVFKQELRLSAITERRQYRQRLCVVIDDREVMF